MKHFLFCLCWLLSLACVKQVPETKEEVKEDVKKDTTNKCGCPDDYIYYRQIQSPVNPKPRGIK